MLMIHTRNTPIGLSKVIFVNLYTSRKAFCQTQVNDVPVCDDGFALSLGSMKSLSSASFIDTGGCNGTMVKFVTHHFWDELFERVANLILAKRC